MSVRAVASTGRRSERAPRSDRGQVTVELLGMAPTIIITLVLMWQCVLVGYTYTLAGNAADEAVRAGTAATGDRRETCEEAGKKDLPSAWRDGADVSCTAHRTGYVTADVSLEVPVLLPGTVAFPLTLHGHAGAVTEVAD
ncbi:TadE family protein [Streptomyces sp. Caat 7-52]|uniref:TadE/TadG family type IV pilus assembly protein n=1 Tax=Streptomyces sp. Caat 7-52 TaxID=2949637 RepID=UPI002035AD7F|nr:TadE family protein [Streptomyces sp. Caat 7-52]